MQDLQKLPVVLCLHIEGKLASPLSIMLYHFLTVLIVRVIANLSVRARVRGVFLRDTEDDEDSKKH